jgi:PKD repeat protein
MTMRTRVFLFLLLAILASSGLASASGDGIAGYSGDPAIFNGRSCEACHGGGFVPVVDLTGPMTVTPGSTSTYTLTISGGQAAWGGLDVSATAGALAATDAGTRLDGGEVVHATPRAAVGNDVTFSFEWTAPASPGTAALYGAGLSSDGGGTGGDETGRIALMISVEDAPAPNQSPVADPGGPYAGTVGAPIAFDGSRSFDPDGTIVSFSWDFGDSSRGAGPTPTHVYAAEGTYTVELTVTDDSGDTSTMTTVANINLTRGNEPPIASAGEPYSGIVGTSITFDGSGSRDPDGTIVSHVWEFGDGSSGSGETAMHTYSAAATYRVTLTVTDDQGASASDAADAVVRDTATSSLLVLVRAPRRVNMDEEGREVKVVVAADTSSLPPGTTGCGTATLFKNNQAVGTDAICIKPPDDEEEEEDDDEDDEERETSRREMRIKTARGVVAVARPTGDSWAKAKFEVDLTSVDAPSVVWTAQVDLAGQTGEAEPVTTQVRQRRP